MLQEEKQNDKFLRHEIAPMHTTEHILNQTMVRMFGCERSKNAHIEKKKSKCDYLLEKAPTQAEVEMIENKVNNIIEQNLLVKEVYTDVATARKMVNLSKLPSDIGSSIRIIHIGDYDSCPCIGKHVNNTSEIGKFKIISHNYSDGIWRVRFRLI